MNRIHLSISTLLLVSALTALAQNTPPVVTNQIADFTEYPTTQRSIDLTTAFTDPDVNVAVRMTTALGAIDVALFGQQKPVTVANFLKYVDQGRFFKADPNNGQVASSFVHRSVTSFVIQGGGWLGTVNAANTNIQPTAVLTFPAIQNEPGISNKRGTIAMAQSGNDPSSATSQWFINLADNGGPPNNLDIRNNNTGPYTVFGRIAPAGMTVVDAIAALPRYDFSNVSVEFARLPLRNYDGFSAVKVPNLVSIPAIARIPTLNFSAVSDNTTAADVVVSGTKLLVSGKQAGTAHVTVTATDLDGATVSQQFTVNVVAAPGRIVQLSTRMQVGTGDNALIGGFIMRGPSPKRLMIRGIGPSSGLNGALADPVLELHDGTGALIASNDNWGDAANKQDIIDTGIAPNSPNESAILVTVASDPNTANYTAIVRGANNTTGLGLVEVYDLDSGPGSALLNISTRGQVDVDPNALIGGFYVGGADSKNILVRAIGPSLPRANVPNPLTDPILELRNGSGTLIDQNDDWGSSPNKTAIQNSGVAPTNPKESAVLQALAAGPYTAIVRGVNNGTGVGSVEVYQLP